MSVLRIKIDTENDAFGEDPCPETARILRELASRIERKGFLDGHRVQDSNGNSVCSTSLDEE